jgi:predicted phosphate transport protein (TIGR00153 family)
MGLFSKFTPSTGKFFEAFSEATSNLVTISARLKDLVQANDDATRENIVREIRDLEHVGDEITHRLFIELSNNFITPFDREDIHMLASALDDIADFINGAASRISLYKFVDTDPVIASIVGVLNRQTTEIHQAVANLKNMKNAQRVREAIIRINDLENEADSTFELAIARLFSEEKDPIALIKKKEILSVIETATDKCEDVANVIESILVKNS